jgi:hypothetical protein
VVRVHVPEPFPPVLFLVLDRPRQGNEKLTKLPAVLVEEKRVAGSRLQIKIPRQVPRHCPALERPPSLFSVRFSIRCIHGGRFYSAKDR